MKSLIFLIPVLVTVSNFSSCEKIDLKDIDEQDEHVVTPVEDNEFLNCLGSRGFMAKAIDRLFVSESLLAFFNYASRDMNESVILQHTDENVLRKLDFDIRRRTVIIVHGYMSNGINGWMQRLQKAFLTWGDVNVILTDWTKESQTLNYPKAAVNTRTIGSQLATVLKNIANETINDILPDISEWGSIYCVGHSLGAHICGYMAKRLKNLSVLWRVARITALDPAQPCFKHSPESLLLQKSDADLVDVIHTNGRPMHKLGLGLPDPIGDIDFFVNGGRVQPNCHQIDKRSFSILIPFVSMWKNSGCDHTRSHEYMIESLYSAVAKNCSMWGYPWDRTLKNADKILNSQLRGEPGCTEMGINAENGRCNGSLLVVTASSPPYCHTGKFNKRVVKRHLRRYHH